MSSSHLIMGRSISFSLKLLAYLINSLPRSRKLTHKQNCDDAYNTNIERELIPQTLFSFCAFLFISVPIYSFDFFISKARKKQVCKERKIFVEVSSHRKRCNYMKK